MKNTLLAWQQLFGDQVGITENNSYINQFYMADHGYLKRALSVLVQESCKTGLEMVLPKTRPRSPWHVGPLWDLTIGP